MFDPKAAWMTMKGGKPSEHVSRFQVTDPQKVVDWMDETRPETDSFASANLAQFAEWWFTNTGEMPDGCDVFEYDTEPVEPTPALTVKEAMVLPAIQANQELFGEVNQLLLGEGE